MVAEIDSRKGVVKVCWAQIRDRVAAVEPELTKIVDELDPDKSFPLFLAYYPYGALKGDIESTLFPDMHGRYYRHNSPDAPKDIADHLGYSKAPLAILLEKNMELFVDLKDERVIIPRAIYTPGSIFPFSALSQVNDPGCAPNGLLTMASGVRSVFMLPNIGCTKNHVNLQRDFNIHSPAPKFLYDHWNVFREITHSAESKSDWQSCIAYFGKKWLESMHKDRGWQGLKLYLYELGWKFHEYPRNHIHYDVIFSLFQKKRNLKPNPYLADTARHLFAIAAGDAPAFIPACENDSLPLDILQRAFVQSYGLKKYKPTIIQPCHFNFTQDNFPIYYSLQNPSTHNFSPKSRKVANTLFEVRELEHLVKIFKMELMKENKMCSNTIIKKIAERIEFKYYHNKNDRHHIIKPTTEIEKHDPRFSHVSPEYQIKDAKVAVDATFLRGCISMSSK